MQRLGSNWSFSERSIVWIDLNGLQGIMEGSVPAGKGTGTLPVRLLPILILFSL